MFKTVLKVLELPKLSKNKFKWAWDELEVKNLFQVQSGTKYLVELKKKLVVGERPSTSL